MHASINNVGNAFKKAFNSTTLSTKAILAAATLGTAIGGSGFANAAVTVSAISTTDIQGPTHFDSQVPGAQAPNFSEFQNTNLYDMKWNGVSRQITGVTAGANVYVPGLKADKITARRNAVSPDRDIIWYRGTGDTNSSQLVFNSGKISSVEQAYSDNNIFTGVDNLFINSGDQSNNNSNIERLDFVFTSGVVTSDDFAFAIFDRGGRRDHDGFKIAAVTSIDPSGNPTSYGDVIEYTSGSWGNVNLVSGGQSLVTRTRNDVPNALQRPASLVPTQNIGGTLIPSTLLVDANVNPVIYGYSIFSFDVNGTGNALLDWNNASVFPTNTPAAAGYGVDPLGSVFVVPEPGMASLLLTAGLGLLVRRRRDRKSGVTTTARRMN